MWSRKMWSLVPFFRNFPLRATWNATFQSDRFFPPINPPEPVKGRDSSDVCQPRPPPAPDWTPRRRRSCWRCLRWLRAHWHCWCLTARRPRVARPDCPASALRQTWWNSILTIDQRIRDHPPPIKYNYHWCVRGRKRTETGCLTASFWLNWRRFEFSVVLSVNLLPLSLKIQ